MIIAPFIQTEQMLKRAKENRRQRFITTAVPEWIMGI